MKRISTLFLLLGLVACAPSVYQISVEGRQPSKSGIDLAGKTMAVVYAERSERAAFKLAFAEGFAKALEKDYFNGEEAVGLFTVEDEDYTSRDSMVSLVMQTDADVVFFVQEPEIGPLRHEEGLTTAVVGVKMLAYDALSGEKDKVRNFNGSVKVSRVGSLDEAAWRPVVDSEAPDLGTRAASSFLSTWKPETYGIYYYDSFRDGWLSGARYASEFKWKEAITEWLTLLDTKNREKKACVEYNIALGCFMSGQSALALKWLDRADRDCPLSQSAVLRKKLEPQKK